MSAMGSHDVHAERRRRYIVHLCDICGTAYDDLADAYDCEAKHEGSA